MPQGNRWVVWHACDGCGRDWPFPEGVPKAVDPVTHERREWHCAICTQALWAKLERDKCGRLVNGFTDNQ